VKTSVVLRDIAEAIAKKIGSNKVTINTFDLITYSRDWSPREATETFLPDIVVRPTSTNDVVDVVRIAAENSIPVIPIGGLTGMGGGTIPRKGGIALDTKGLNRILELDLENLTVTVQAGMTILEINRQLEKHGLWFPHDPESKPSSTIGAAVACDSDGTFASRYGKMASYLLNAVVVTGRGEAVRVGHRKAGCSSTGYKLHWLLLGSEGTLGVVTEVTLKVMAKPAARRVEMITLPSVRRAIECVKRLHQAGLPLESIHINCKRRLGFYTHAYRVKYGRDPEIPDWAEALLCLTFSGDKAVVDFSGDYALSICSEMGGEVVKEREIVNSWWTSKHTLEFEPYKQKWPDSQRKKKFGAADLGIPLGRVEEAYQRFLEIAERNGLEVLGMCIYNQAPNTIGTSISFAVFVDDTDPAEVEGFYRYVEEMSKMAVDLEGTMSTYIGDGERLVRLNRYEHGKAYDYMRMVKEVFDPGWIMNPGKKLLMEGH